MRYATKISALFVVLIASIFFLSCMSPTNEQGKPANPNVSDQGHPSGLSQDEITKITALAAEDWGVPPEKIHIGTRSVSMSDMAVSLSYYIAKMNSGTDEPSLGKESQRRHLFDCWWWWCSDERTIDQGLVSNVRVYVSTASLIPYVDQAIAYWNNSGSKVHFRRVTSGSYDTHLYETGSIECGGSAIGCADYPTAGSPGEWIEIRDDWSSWPWYWGGVTKVIIHELGHTLSLSHTDVNEDNDEHIAGTPDMEDAYSIMNSSAYYTNGFTYWDGMAARILYPLDQDQSLSHMGDVDGDGLKDLIIIGDNGVTVATQNGYGGFNEPVLWIHEFSKEQGWNASTPRYFGDFNGDGLTDILGFGAAGAHVATSTGSGFSSSLWLANMGGNQGWTVTYTPRIPADVNGDGKMDFMAHGLNDTYACISGGSSFTCSLWSSDFGHNDGWTNASTLREYADMTGDGKADLIAIGLNDTYVCTSSGSGFSGCALWSSDYAYNDGWTHAYTLRTFADVTGDGKADMVAIGLNDTYVCTSSGSGFSGCALWNTDYAYNDGWTHEYTVRKFEDVTGDGKADLVAIGLNDTYVRPSTGSAFSGGGLWSSDYAYNDGWAAHTPRLLADINNDGTVDLAAVGANEWIFNYSTGSGFSSSLALQYRTY